MTAKTGRHPSLSVKNKNSNLRKIQMFGEFSQKMWDFWGFHFAWLSNSGMSVFFIFLFLLPLACSLCLRLRQILLGLYIDLQYLESALFAKMGSETCTFEIDFPNRRLDQHCYKPSEIRRSASA